MIHQKRDLRKTKGWFVGPWNSPLDIPIGYANQGIDELHVHERMCEVYLVAQGKSIILIDDREFSLQAGDIIVVEPGEAHTFKESSNDYLHFVIHTPFVKGDKTVIDK